MSREVASRNEMLHVRVDSTTKAEAQRTLSLMGMTMAEAVRIFLHRVVADQAFPLELKVPKAETIAAMQEARAMGASGRARFSNADELFDDLEKNDG